MTRIVDPSTTGYPHADAGNDRRVVLCRYGFLADSTIVRRNVGWLRPVTSDPAGRLPPNPNRLMIMKHLLTPVSVACGLLALPCGAALIATENFEYPDGSVVGRSGGTGWTYGNDPGQDPSAWTAPFGTPTIASEALVTGGAGSGALRNFGSNGTASSFSGSDVLYFSATMTTTGLPESGGRWGGISIFEGGTERLFFGMPNQNPANADTPRYFGFEIHGGGGITLLTPTVDTPTVPTVVNDVTYTIVGMVDFGNDIIGLWINPDASDAGSPDLSVPYTGNTPITAIRFASGGGASTTTAWDDVRIGTTFADVVTVPEPSVTLTALFAAGFLVGRRRR